MHSEHGIQAATRKASRRRFDNGVLHVAASNPRMLQATAGKLGAEPLSVFDVTVAIGLSWFASIAKIPRCCRLATV